MPSLDGVPAVFAAFHLPVCVVSGSWGVQPADIPWQWQIWRGFFKVSTLVSAQLPSCHSFLPSQISTETMNEVQRCPCVFHLYLLITAPQQLPSYYNRQVKCLKFIWNAVNKVMLLSMCNLLQNCAYHIRNQIKVGFFWPSVQCAMQRRSGDVMWATMNFTSLVSI